MSTAFCAICAAVLRKVLDAAREHVDECDEDCAVRAAIDEYDAAKEKQK